MQALPLYYALRSSTPDTPDQPAVHAMAPGLAAEDIAVIAAHSRYQRPDYTAGLPAEAAEWAEYPPALRYYPLPSGRVALTRVCYRGADSHGKPGNAFAHTLVLPPAALEVWPVMALDWEGWHDTPDVGVDVPLAPVSVDFAPSARYTAAALAAFLTDQPRRPLWLTELVTALLLYPQWQRALVIRDLPAHGPLWLAAITQLLPLAQALTVSLSSYQYATDHAALINATTAGSGFDYQHIQHGQAFFIFDALSGEKSTIPVTDAAARRAHAYAEQTSAWLLTDPARLADCHRFAAACCDLDAVSPDLYWTLTLYRYLSEPALRLDPAELAALAEFCTAHVHRDAWPELAAALVAAPQRLTAAPDLAAYRQLLALLSTAAKATGQAAERVHTVTLWLALYDDRVLTQQRDPEPVLTEFTLLEQAFPGQRPALYAAVLDPVRLHALSAATAQFTTAELGELAGWLWHCIRQQELATEQALDCLTPLAVALCGHGQPAAPWLTRLFKQLDDAELLADLSARLWQHSVNLHGPARDLIAATLTGHLAALPAPAALTARVGLNRQQAFGLLFAEWQQLLARSSDKPALYRRYRREVLTPLPAYRDCCAGEIGATLFATLSPREQIEQALVWISDDEDWPRLPDTLAATCVQQVNTRLPLTLRDSAAETLAGQVHQYAQELGLTLTPHKPQLRTCLHYLREEGMADAHWYEEAGSALTGCQAADYRYFLKQTLPVLLADATQATAHRQLLAALNQQPALFEPLYLKYLDRLLRRRTVAQAAAALHFWLAQPAEPFTAAVQTQMLTRLARWNDRQLARLGDAVTALLQPEPYALRQYWEQFRQSLDTRRQSPWTGRLKAIALSCIRH